MADILGKVGLTGAGALSWASGMPTGVVVLLGLAAIVMPPVGQWLLAHERTRLERTAWQGAVAVYLAQGDGAGVARGLRAESPGEDSQGTLLASCRNCPEPSP